MKSKIIFLVLMLFSTMFYGQDSVQTKVEQILSNFADIQLVKNLSNLKNNIENDIYHIKSKNLTKDSIEPIRLQYEVVKDKYNYIFDEMKRDLITGSSKTNFAKLERKYKSNIDDINNEYIKFQNEINLLEGSKSISIIALIGAGIEIFNFVKKQIDLHQNWGTQVQQVFSIFTPMLMNKFYLKNWSDLWPEYQNINSSILDINLSQSNKTDLDMVSRPYYETNDSAKIQIYKIDDVSKTKTIIKLRSINKYENIEVLQSVNSYAPNTRFTLKINTVQFIYFFAINKSKLELLYPISSTKSTIIGTDNIDRDDYTYAQTDQNSIEIPNSKQAFVIDSVGNVERWIIIVSKSEIFNATKFANNYLINVNNTNNRLLKGTYVGSGVSIDNYTILDENTDQKYCIKDLVKIYDVQLNKRK